MAERRRDAEFTEYVTARTPWLRKVAYLLSGDWHRADDLVQTTITKLYGRDKQTLIDAAVAAAAVPTANAAPSVLP